MSQPAASQSLAKLRSAFRDPLFVRSGQGVTPTARAMKLEAFVNQLLDDAARLLLPDDHFDAAHFDGTITVAASDYLAITLHDAVLPQLARVAPKMRICVRSTERDSPSMLDNHDIDLALGYFPEHPSWHVRERLFEDDFVCIFSPQQLSFDTPLSLDAYVSAPHVMGSLRGEFESVVDERLAQLGRRRHVMVSTSHFLSLMFQVRFAPVLATVPMHIASHCEKIGLVHSPVPLTLPSFTVSLLWHDRERDNAPHRWFRELLTASIRDRNYVAPAANEEQTDQSEEVG